jgi:hypothetical protein
MVSSNLICEQYQQSCEMQGTAAGRSMHDAAREQLMHAIHALSHGTASTSSTQLVHIEVANGKAVLRSIGGVPISMSIENSSFY